MYDSTPPQSENDWTVMISVREREGQTQATARLRLGDHESVGVGLSRLSPAEHGSAGTGGELAVARAVSDLARHSCGNRRRKADPVIDVDDVDAEHHQPVG